MTNPYWYVISWKIETWHAYAGYGLYYQEQMITINKRWSD